MKKKILALGLAAVFAAISLSACGGSKTATTKASEAGSEKSTEKGSEKASESAKETEKADSGKERVYKVGVNGSDHEEWEKVNELLKKDNIKVDLVEFSDYVKPNEALEDGEIDLHSRQRFISTTLTRREDTRIWAFSPIRRLPRWESTLPSTRSSMKQQDILPLRFRTM